MRRHKKRTERAVSATQLAELGHCEMRMLLAHAWANARRQSSGRPERAEMPPMQDI